MNVFKQALYTKLTGGTALVAKLAGTASVYDMVPPSGATFPYVVFGYSGGGYENITPVRYKNFLYFVKAVSKTSSKNAGEIDAEIDALLHDTTLTVTGWTNFSIAREDDLDYTEFDREGRSIWHVGGVYRVRLCETS